jgi:hypothetical protein
MLEIVEGLLHLLKRGGDLAFTFIDPQYYSWPEEFHGNNLLWRLERDQGLYPEVNVDIEGITRRAEGARWFIIVNDTDLYIETDDLACYEPERQRTCHTFYSVEYIMTLFPNARVLPPANSEMQHCCIISP